LRLSRPCMVNTLLMSGSFRERSATGTPPGRRSRAARTPQVGAPDKCALTPHEARRNRRGARPPRGSDKNGRRGIRQEPCRSRKVIPGEGAGRRGAWRNVRLQTATRKKCPGAPAPPAGKLASSLSFVAKGCTAGVVVPGVHVMRGASVSSLAHSQVD